MSVRVGFLVICLNDICSEKITGVEAFEGNTQISPFI